MHDEKRHELRTRVVALLAALRAEYLAAGASPLKHWDQLQDRVRVAARTSETVAQWVTTLPRLLGLSAPSKERSSATRALVEVVGEDRRAAAAFLDQLEEEVGLLMALTQEEAERRKAVRIEAKEKRERETGVDIGALPLEALEDK